MASSDSVRIGYFSRVDDEKRAQRVFQFRKQLFVDVLGWSLNLDGDFESDQFDRPDTVYCTLCAGDELVGSFRAIRTDRPYLAEMVFPDAAGPLGYPKSPDIWEISRFGVSVNAQRFTMARILYAAMLRFAHDRGATALVAVADEGYERFLAMLGITSKRYGAAVPIGADSFGRPLSIVAGEIPMNAQSGRRYDDLMQLAFNLEIDNATHVFGRTLLSA